MKTADGHLSPLVTSARLAVDMTQLGLRAGDAVLLHASLRALGGTSTGVLGGAVAVIEAATEVLAEDGLLVMPAFSAEYSDPAHWGNPPVDAAWWPVVRQYMPAFRGDTTPTSHIGRVAECFRSMPGVRRSDHPSASFCARGADAAALLANHPLSGALGDASPLGGLYERDAKVLMLGTPYGTCTAFHLSEARMERPPAPLVQGAPLLRDGQRAWVGFDDRDWSSEDFDALGAAWDKHGEVRRAPVGHARAQLFSLRAAVDFGVSWLNANRRD